MQKVVREVMPMPDRMGRKGSVRSDVPPEPASKPLAGAARRGRTALSPPCPDSHHAA